MPIHSFGELNGRLYLDMEFIEGIDGAMLLHRQGRLAPEPAVRIIMQAAAALDAAHRIGLVHRDVKPSNLMVTPSGFVYLIDFGTATRAGQPPITANDQVIGTLGYLAPERFDGAAEPRSDQYALACVLYELLTHRRPFGDGDSPQQMRAHLMAAPPVASDLVAAVPAALDAVIARGMAKNPSERWSSAGEFAAAAYAAATGQDVSTAEIAPRVAPTTSSASVAHPATVRAWAPQYAARPLPTRKATRPRTSVPVRQRPRLAFAALAALTAVICGALWLGRPGAAGPNPPHRPRGPAPSRQSPRCPPRHRSPRHR